MNDDTMNTVFSETVNVRNPIWRYVGVDPGGLESTIASANPNFFTYVTLIQMICQAASTTATTWQLRRATGGAVIMNVMQPIAIAPVGTVFNFPFDQPFKSLLQNGNITMQQLQATGGTWSAYVNGFYSST